MRLATLLLVLVMAVFAGAQNPTPAQMAGVGPQEGMGIFNMTTRLGSFKLLDGIGRVEVSFTGTFLISQLRGLQEGRQPVLQVSGNLRREYQTRDRIAYFGTGKIVIVGRFRGLQWFGRNMTGFWYGRGVARLSGEFDRNLETGWYWYRNPERRRPWMATGSFEARVPDPNDAGDVTPRARPMPPGIRRTR